MFGKEARADYAGGMFPSLLLAISGLFQLSLIMAAFHPKADMDCKCSERPLVTQSGHLDRQKPMMLAA